MSLQKEITPGDQDGPVSLSSQVKVAYGVEQLEQLERKDAFGTADLGCLTF